MAEAGLCGFQHRDGGARKATHSVFHDRRYGVWVPAQRSRCSLGRDDGCANVHSSNYDGRFLRRSAAGAASSAGATPSSRQPSTSTARTG
jgi:hypothetical protein